MRIRYIPNWFERSVSLDVDLPPNGSLRAVLPEVQAVEQLYIWRNGERVYTTGDDWILDAEERDALVCACAPHGIDPVSIGITLAISFAASFVISKLILPPQQSSDTDDGGPTYGFDGLRSVRTEGRPIALVYGFIRTAGTILNEGVENLPTPDGHSRYFAQVGIGSGPIESVGDQRTNTTQEGDLATDISGRAAPEGIYFDGNAARNIRGVTAAVRLGTIDQQRCVGFDYIEAPADVGQELLAPETSTTNPSTPLVHPTSTTQAAQDTYWGNYGRSFDLEDEADWARVTLTFTRGWYVSGSPNSARWFSAAVRYIELDGNGQPITSGGDFGDGYIRLPRWVSYFNSSAPFSVDLHFPLLDARAYTVVTGGTSLEGDGTNNASMCSVTTPSVPWTDSTNISALSVSAWIRVDELTIGAVENSFVWAYQKTSTTGGFAARLLKKTFAVSPTLTLVEWVPVLEMPGSSLAGDQFFEGHDASTRRPRFYIKDPDDHDEQRHHIVFTYASRTTLGSPGATDRLRLYVNGLLLYETTGNIQLKGSTATFYAGRDPTLLVPMDGTVDELWVLHTEMTVDQVYRAYNVGAGVPGAVGTSGLPGVFPAAQVVFGYHFDENLASGTALGFGTTYTNNATVAGAGMTIQGRTGVVRHSPVNAIRRARYRIEVARNIAISTDTASIDEGLTWSRCTGVIDQQQRHPGTALVSLRVEASEDLNSRTPDIALDVRGRHCPVWTGTDPLTPSFVRQWTRNPAWVCTDMLTTRSVGLGDRYTTAELDVASFGELASYSDEIIYDLSGNYMTGDLAATVTPVRVSRLRYDTTVSGQEDFDLRGGRIQVFLDGPPPPSIKEGQFIAWTGEATASGFVDHNISGTGGYEIKHIVDHGTGTWRLDVYWDRDAEGIPWTDGQYLDLMAGLSTVPYVGTYEGRVRRHTYDAVHDVAEGAWDVLREVASIGRATLLFDGSKIRARVNKPRQPVGVVSVASIIAGTFEVEYGGPQDRPNAYTIEFLDEDNGWERSSVYVEHESVTDTSNFEDVRHETIFVRGITRRAAAMRHGKFLANANQLIKRIGSFQAAVDAIHYEVGDVLVLQHDLVPWGTGGRTRDGATTQSEIVLDRPITIVPSGSHLVDVSHPSSNRLTTRQIVSAPGTYSAGSVLTLDAALTFVPAAGLRYVFYTPAQRMLAEITGLRLARDLAVNVEWAEYVESVYNDDPTPTIAPGSEAPTAAWATQDGLSAWGLQDLSGGWGLQGT